MTRIAPPVSPPNGGHSDQHKDAQRRRNRAGGAFVVHEKEAGGYQQNIQTTKNPEEYGHFVWCICFALVSTMASFVEASFRANLSNQKHIDPQLLQGYEHKTYFIRGSDLYSFLFFLREKATKTRS